MSREKKRDIASMGGRKAHEQGRAHVFTSETAREAAKKGWARRRAAQPAQDSYVQDDE